MKIDARLKRGTVTLFPPTREGRRMILQDIRKFCWNLLGRFMNFGAKIYGKFSSFSFSAHENTACALSFQCYAYKKLQQNVVLEGKCTVQTEALFLSSTLILLLSCSMTEYSEESFSLCFLVSKLKQAEVYIAFSFLMWTMKVLSSSAASYQTSIFKEW